MTKGWILGARHFLLIDSVFMLSCAGTGLAHLTSGTMAAKVFGGADV
jgi:hypothetical protein